MGNYIFNAFYNRNIKCIHYKSTKSPVPRIVERINDDNHYYYTKCPKCGKNLVKCILPSINQIDNSKLYTKTPNIFFFDRISDGIIKCATNNKTGWNVYEPNSSRNYINLLRGVKLSHIVKYSQERISPIITERLLRDSTDSNVVLLIVTMGDKGLKYVYRKNKNEYSDWYYLSAFPVKNLIDSSGSGDWLTAVFLYQFINEYNNYIDRIDQTILNRCLNNAQQYASYNCSFWGAQGILRNKGMIDLMNKTFDCRINPIFDSNIGWSYNCDFCLSE
jgi:hypothetical protein